VDTSRYTVDSVILTLHDSNVFNFTITQDLLGPVYGPEFLNTSYMDGILPGLIAHYGKNQPMSINFATKQAPSSFFQVGKMGLTLTADLQVYVNSDLAATIEVISAEGSLSATLNNFLLVIKLLTFYINDAQVVNSEIGPINVQAMRNFVNFFAYLALPVINGFLAPGFHLPQEYFGIVRIREATFDAMDGYCQVGIVPEFI